MRQHSLTALLALDIQCHGPESLHEQYLVLDVPENERPIFLFHRDRHFHRHSEFTARVQAIEGMIFMALIEDERKKGLLRKKWLRISRYEAYQGFNKRKHGKTKQGQER